MYIAVSTLCMQWDIERFMHLLILESCTYWYWSHALTDICTGKCISLRAWPIHAILVNSSNKIGYSQICEFLPQVSIRLHCMEILTGILPPLSLHRNCALTPIVTVVSTIPMRNAHVFSVTSDPPTPKVLWISDTLNVILFHNAINF